ncbi:MAG TPA: DUF2231 domain-containing protein [Burkholderiaceae bacterium]
MPLGFKPRLNPTSWHEGHTLHVVFVAFPITLLVGALVTDLGFLGTGDRFWAYASEWLLGAGIVAGAFAAGTGLLAFLTLRRVRGLAVGWLHFLGNATALAVSGVSLYLRWGHDPATVVVPAGISLSAAVVCIFLITAWLGGEMALRDHFGVIQGGAVSILIGLILLAGWQQAVHRPSAGASVEEAGVVVLPVGRADFGRDDPAPTARRRQ